MCQGRWWCIYRDGLNAHSTLVLADNYPCKNHSITIFGAKEGLAKDSRMRGQDNAWQTPHVGRGEGQHWAPRPSRSLSGSVGSLPFRGLSGSVGPRPSRGLSGSVGPRPSRGLSGSVGPLPSRGLSGSVGSPPFLSSLGISGAPLPSRGLSGSVGSPPLLGFSGSVKVSGPPALLGVSQGQLGSSSFHPQGHTQVLRDSEHRLRTESSSGPELSARISSRVSVISWIGQHQGRPLKVVCLRSVHPP